MTLDPSKRITARQALSHPYFTAPIEADARRFVREDWSQPDVVGAVERGTKRMIRKRQLAERDEEAREAGEAGDDTSGSKREVEVEAPSGPGFQPQSLCLYTPAPMPTRPRPYAHYMPHIFFWKGTGLGYFVLFAGTETLTPVIRAYSLLKYE
jgi:hypothetical protein